MDIEIQDYQTLSSSQKHINYGKSQEIDTESLEKLVADQINQDINLKQLERQSKPVIPSLNFQNIKELDKIKQLICIPSLNLKS